jgi:hypothetical protein
MRLNNTIYILLAGVFIFQTACVSTDSEKSKRKVDLSTTEVEVEKETSEERANQVKRIFFTLPSPLELSLLFKKEGIVYYPEQLHQREKADKYLVSRKKALNLGIYGADLSYAGLFSKHEDALEYFAICQSIAEEVGISNSFEKDFISRLERNSNNRDTLLQVISDFFLNNDSYLKDQDLQNTSAYVLTGGWIEGLYLGTMMVNDKTNAEGLGSIIASQKYSLENLILMLNHIEDKGEFGNINIQLNELLNLFQAIEYPSYKEPTDSIDADGVQVLDNSSGEINISEETFEAIKEKVSSIRKSIIE